MENQMSIEQAFNNLAVGYERFFSGTKEQHMIMQMSLESVRSGLVTLLAEHPELMAPAPENAEPSENVEATEEAQPQEASSEEVLDAEEPMLDNSAEVGAEVNG